MTKTFEKTLSVHIDNTTLRCVVERILDDISNSDLLDYISCSLDDESEEAFEIIRENDDFVIDNIVTYVTDAILEKFEIEKE